MRLSRLKRLRAKDDEEAPKMPQPPIAYLRGTNIFKSIQHHLQAMRLPDNLNDDEPAPAAVP